MTITVLGVPDSAGAYCVGVEDAPTALRDAGLLTMLRDRGHEVVDAGDLTRRTWSPDPENPRIQNIVEEITAAEELRDTAAPLLRTGHRLVVLGGSCTVAIGLCAAMATTRTPRLVYIDRHFDLNTPESTTEGSLSWMGLAHCLDLPGTSPELSRVGERNPLLQPQDLVYLGVEPSQGTDWEIEQQRSMTIPLVSQGALIADPPGAAQQALRALGDGDFIVHLDVDVLDFLDAPLAENVNGRNTGPTIDHLGQALSVLWRNPHCLALSLGQLVPAHAASSPSALARFTTMLSRLADG